jgi:hypothetical protein
VIVFISVELNDTPSGLASVITVIVGTGDQQRTVVLHEALLRQSSVFFDNALKPELKEAHDRAITTIETCPKSFATYAKFLFTGVIFIQPDGEIYSV